MITAVFDDEGRHVGFAKVTRDLTERRKAEEDARRLAEAEAVRDTAETLQRASSAFASALSSAGLASAVFSHVLPSLGADGGSIAVRIPGTDQLRLAWTHGYSAQALQKFGEFSIDRSLPHADAARELRPIFWRAELRSTTRIRALSTACTRS